MKTETAHDKPDKARVSVFTVFNYGYMRDLGKLNAPGIVSELQKVGILKTGYSSKGKTYSLRRFGVKYCGFISIKGKSVICILFNGLARGR